VTEFLGNPPAIEAHWSQQMLTDSCKFFYICKGCGEQAEGRRLLRVLFMWVAAMPAGATRCYN
jgi:hypothetical protein